MKYGEGCSFGDMEEKVRNRITLMHHRFDHRSRTISGTLDKAVIKHTPLMLTDSTERLGYARHVYANLHEHRYPKS